MFIRCNVAISVARLEVNPASASCKCSSKFWGHPQKELKTCFVLFFVSHLFAAGTRVHDVSQKAPRKLVTDLRPAASIRFFPTRCLPIRTGGAITGKSLAGTARMWNAMYNRRPRLSRSTLDVAMPGLFYQTSAAVFRCNCFLQHLASLQSIDQRAQKKINKIRRSISKICLLHCGASTGHKQIRAMA